MVSFQTQMQFSENTFWITSMQASLQMIDWCCKAAETNQKKTLEVWKSSLVCYYEFGAYWTTFLPTNQLLDRQQTSQGLPSFMHNCLKFGTLEHVVIVLDGTYDAAKQCL